MKKSIFLFCVFLLSATNIFAQSGSVGTLTWTIDDGTLTISGNGPITGFLPMNPGGPWKTYASSITAVVVEEGVTAIGNMSLLNLPNCTSLSLPVTTLTSIGNQAFANCPLLPAVDIPGSVTSILDNAFNSCLGLQKVTVQWDTPLTVNANVFNNINLSNLTLKVPGGKKSVYETADVWKDFGTIEEMGQTTGPLEWLLDNGVLTIKGSGEMPDYEFMPPNVAPWNASRSSITSVVVEEGVTKIGNNAFLSCNNLTSVSIPRSLTSIGTAAFSGCSQLSAVDISDKVTSIANQAFSGCAGLQNVRVHWAEPLAVGNVFPMVDLGNVTLTVPYDSKALYEAANVWKDFGTITSVGGIAGNLEWSLEYGLLTVKGTGMMQDYEFMPPNVAPWSAYKSSVTSVVVKEGVTSIGAFAFQMFSNLLDVSFPAGLESIGVSAFDGCSKLKNIDIPVSVNNIASKAFNSCTVLQSVKVHWNTPLVIVADVFNMIDPANVRLTVPFATKTLYQAADVWKNFIIQEEPDPCANGQINLYDISWRFCADSDSTLILSGQGEMPNFYEDPIVPWAAAPWAIYRSSINKIIVGEGITNIGNTAFEDFENLVSVTLPESLTSIRKSVFSGCSALNQINIPVGITSIDSLAFAECTALDSVFVHWDTPLDIPLNVFEGVSLDNVILSVPEGTEALYKAANVWKNFKFINDEPVESGTTLLGYSSDNIRTAVGIGASYSAEAAILIPKEMLKKYVGNFLKQVKVGFGAHPATKTKIFVRSSLNDEQGYSQDADFETSKWNEITLSSPYEIVADQDLVIGYSFLSGSGNNVNHIGLDDSQNTDANGDYLRYGRGTYLGAWMHIGEQVNGNLCIIGVVEGENMSLHDVNLYELYVPSTIDVNEKLSIKGNFKNEGGKNVTDLEVSYKIGENEKVIKPLAELDIAPGGKYTFTISDIEFEKEVNRIYQVEVSIEKVNGKIDDYPEDNTLQSDVRIWDAPDAPTIVSTAPSNKNVVLEEFTGINCQWCPAGHKIANEIKAANPGRVSVINIHTGIYANGTTPDFTTAYGAAIDSQAGTTGYPMGTVNRHLFAAGSGVTALDRSFFVRSSNEILRQASYVNIGVKTDLNEETRELIVDVELYYTAQGSAINMLNIALVQDSIIGPQVGASANYPAMGSDSRYQHNHMLRDLITGQWGDSIRQTASGTFVAKRYYYVVPEKVKDTPVNLDKIEIITFVAQGSQEIITGCSNKSIETGFSSPEVNNGITAYIADGYLYINSEVPVQSADVYAVSGQQVLSVSNIDHAISVAALSSGVYTVKLKTAEGYKIVKVIF